MFYQAPVHHLLHQFSFWKVKPGVGRKTNATFTCLAPAALCLATPRYAQSSHNRLALLYGNQPSARRQPSRASGAEPRQPGETWEIKVRPLVWQEGAQLHAILSVSALPLWRYVICWACTNMCITVIIVYGKQRCCFWVCVIYTLRYGTQ